MTIATDVATDKSSAASNWRKPWWERLPDRRREELDALSAAGIRFEIDPVAEGRGLLRLHVFLNVNGEELPLDVEFPRSYPYFRFEVMAPTLELVYHQHPFGKALCLLPRGTEHWHPGSDRLADFLIARLPQTLELARAGEVAAAETGEEHQAEPFTDYYQYYPDTLVIVDGTWRLPPDVQGGSFDLGVESQEGGDPGPVVRGAVIAVRDYTGRELVRADEALVERFPRRVTGAWARSPKPPMTLRAEAIFREADDRLASPTKGPDSGWTAAGNSRVTVRAVVFPEEVHWRGEHQEPSDGWIIAVRVAAVVPLIPKNATQTSQQRALYKSVQARRDHGPEFYLARAWRAGPADMRERVPELAPLAHATVALFGAGCLGAPSVLELARSMIGELRVLDSDVVDPATTVRWPFGLGAAGRRKTVIVKDFIHHDFPYTRVRTFDVKIGSAGGVDVDESAALEEMVAGASLIYDATAESGVQYYLADVARDIGIPYVSVSGTQGGWGGLVVRIRPQHTEGCWMCLQHAFENDGAEFSDFRIPKPTFNARGGTVQPHGCADPTYTGANFDLAEVALMGVRTAVSTLCEGDSSAYPSMNWDIAVLRLRSPTGQFIPPAWSTHRLRRHPACAACNSRPD